MPRSSGLLGKVTSGAGRARTEVSLLMEWAGGPGWEEGGSITASMAIPKACCLLFS